MRSYSGVETKKPEMQASEASVRKMAARQNNNFDGVTVSYKAHSCKPDRKIFEYAISTMGIVPQETLFFDDGQENLDVAAQLGFRTALVEPGVEFMDIITNLENQ